MNSTASPSGGVKEKRIAIPTIAIHSKFYILGLCWSIVLQEL
jgi:hypothetical protein